MKLIFKFVLVMWICMYAQSNTQAQVTYTEDIAEIIYNKCTVCHRAGEIGPMSFTNYDEVKNWATMIKYTTGIKYMPPWKADPEYSRFLGENYLTDEEIEMIATWVDAGAPEGNPDLEPSIPLYTEGSQLGEPDLVLSFEQSHLHKGNNRDEYRYFVLPTGLTEDKVLKALEFRAGNNKIVHHALFFEDTEGKAAANDAATPEYGFEGFGGFATDSQIELLTSKQYPGYAPGQKARYYPDGIGSTMSAGSDLVVQVHYAPWSVDEIDSSSVNLFFADESEVVERMTETHIMVPLPGTLVNGQFFLLPGDVKTFHGIWQAPKDISIVSITPHMHLLGMDWEVYIETPDGEIINLISIPEWDFNWQGTFQFDEYKIAPKGSKIHAFATYDNTAENPNNPTNPPKFVTWGENTTDEMYYLPITYVDYQEGDEDISFSDSTTPTEEVYHSQSRLEPIAPNPVNGMMQARFYLDRGQAVSAQILDVHGKKVRVLRRNEFFTLGNHYVHFNADHLETGVYFLSISGSNFSLIEKFVKQ